MENFENEVVNETEVMEAEEVCNEGLEALVEAELGDSEVAIETSEEDEKLGTGVIVGMVAGVGLAGYGLYKIAKDHVVPGCKKIKDDVSAKLEEKKAIKEAKKAAKLEKKVVIDNVPPVAEAEVDEEEE